MAEVPDDDRLEVRVDGSAICLIAVGSHGDPLDLGEEEVETLLEKLQEALTQVRQGEAIPGLVTWLRNPGAEVGQKSEFRQAARRDYCQSACCGPVRPRPRPIQFEGEKLMRYRAATVTSLIALAMRDVT